MHAGHGFGAAGAGLGGVDGSDDGGCKRRCRRVLEEHPERELGGEDFEEATHDLGGEEGVAAEIEEAVFAADFVCLEDVGLEARDGFLDRALRGFVGSETGSGRTLSHSRWCSENVTMSGLTLCGRRPSDRGRTSAIHRRCFAVRGSAPSFLHSA